MDYHISSLNNRIYKDCVRLARRKYRDKEARYMVEGWNVVEEAFASGATVEGVIFRQEIPSDRSFPCRTYTMEAGLFDRISQTETSQGIIAILAKDPDAGDTFQRCAQGDGNLLVLDQVQTPGNIGTMIRTVEGAGYAGVLCVKGTGDVYGPKAVRAAAGALFRVPILTGMEAQEVPDYLKKAGKKLVVTAMDGVDYRQADLSRNVALVIGNEGSGVSPSLMERADLRVSIPMQGELESLNASVAAGILMYEAMR